MLCALRANSGAFEIFIIIIIIFLSLNCVCQDRYILSLMIFTFLIAVWHGVVTLWDDDTDSQKTHDFWAFITFIIIYVLQHIAFVLIMMFSVRPSDRVCVLVGVWVSVFVWWG